MIVQIDQWVEFYFQPWGSFEIFLCLEADSVRNSKKLSHTIYMKS